ncbi:uncharacterized protein [Diadema antillarum]|uniref:uncharacterized protein n=1 Tax=Diadema antillarum TaxID=105358 RepID=UPI003A867244
MDEEEGVSIDEIRLWTVPQLKAFLKKRKLKVSGRKDELVALVFAAKQVPSLAPEPTSDPSEERASKLEDLLMVRNTNLRLPNPDSLQDWEGEQKAITKWPPTMVLEIGQYLENIDNVPLKRRLLSDYKDGKGYSYFASGRVKEIQYNGIASDSDYCFLRTECWPSQNINNVPWKVWVSLHKKSGSINSTYCTCFAG